MGNQTDLSAWLGCDAKAAFNMFASKGRLQSWLPTGISVKSLKNGRFKITWTIHFMDDTKTTLNGRILAYEPNKYLAFEFSSQISKSIMNSSAFSTQMIIYFLPMPGEKSGNARFTEVHMVLSDWGDVIHGDFLKSWFRPLGHEHSKD